MRRAIPAFFADRSLAAPLAVGAVARLAAALAGYGWFAPDDYMYVVEQAGRWLHDAHAPFACAYRSVLLPRLFWLSLLLGQRLGITDPARLLQFGYVLLGVASLAAIPAVYRLAAQRWDAATGRTAAWLMAIYAIVPRIATRALIETAAMVPLIWGAVHLDAARTGAPRHRFVRALAGGLLVGVAALFRFQVGVLFPVALVLVCGKQRSGRAAAVAGVLCGGAVAALVQGAIDWTSGRTPLSTIATYLTYNVAHASDYGVSAWYTYVLQFLLFTVPPATLLLWRPWLQAAREHVTVSVLWVAFVAVHSVIGHKEDRFMFPVLPLFFVLLAAALQGLRHSRHPWAKPSLRFFWAVNLLALVIATFSDAQRNLTVPLLHIARLGGAPRVAMVGVDTVPRYYLGYRNDVQRFDNVDALLRAPTPADYVLLRHPPDATVAQQLRALPCDPPVTYEGDWVDRALVALNPRNKRRSPTALLHCHWPEPDTAESRP